ncbi:unnamed protein product [Blepharisma stoltei]|uniref:Uncharacterized protein n=1 Tax=Blepharisma stoltei TaxID=1481888 RepID=A0AAU9IB95_9CILI|nr:unnamed protein product [Blepharisma stoltei]
MQIAWLFVFLFIYKIEKIAMPQLFASLKIYNLGYAKLNQIECNNLSENKRALLLILSLKLWISLNFFFFPNRV